jgi:hypothetical protein
VPTVARSPAVHLRSSAQPADRLLALAPPASCNSRPLVKGSDSRLACASTLGCVRPRCHTVSASPHRSIPATLPQEERRAFPAAEGSPTSLGLSRLATTPSAMADFCVATANYFRVRRRRQQGHVRPPGDRAGAVRDASFHASRQRGSGLGSLPEQRVVPDVGVAHGQGMPPDSRGHVARPHDRAIVPVCRSSGRVSLNSCWSRRS